MRMLVWSAKRENIAPTCQLVRSGNREDASLGDAQSTSLLVSHWFQDWAVNAVKGVYTLNSAKKAVQEYSLK